MSTGVKIVLIIIGIIILIFSIAILYANRAERAKRIADELVEPKSVSPENEGKLVIVSGVPELVGGGVIFDKETGLQVENAVHYSRTPYQKVYVQKSRSVVVDEGEDKLSTDDYVTEIEYYIAEDWIPAYQERDEVIVIGSSRYENPPAINLRPYYAATDLAVAGFQLAASDISDCIETENRGFTKEELAASCGKYIQDSGLNMQVVLRESGSAMLSSGDEIGDIHVLFSYETLEGASPVTLVGRQQGSRIIFDDNDPVSESERVKSGNISKEEFLSSISAEDATSRKIGIVGLVLGAALILIPIIFRLKNR